MLLELGYWNNDSKKRDYFQIGCSLLLTALGIVTAVWGLIVIFSLTDVLGFIVGLLTLFLAAGIWLLSYAIWKD